MSVRVRYAPSPTGSPHVGNLRTAIYDWLFARKEGGQFITRLEDTDRDPTRYKPEYIQDIENSLHYLGITPDEWWVSGGPCAPYVQSERLELYQHAAEELIKKGLAYRCYCTEERLTEMRDRQQRQGLPTGYDRRCRYLSKEDRKKYQEEGMPSVVRLAVPMDGKTTYHDLVYGDISFENKLIDDQVLLKSNGWPTYHLAVVVDDHHMGITHVIRGEDWMPSTPKQILLYNALGWEPPLWVHVPLIVGKDKKKLSKRHGSTQFIEFIREGYLPEALFNFLVLLGWSAGDENVEILSKEDILQRFSLNGITNHPAVFDYDKLKWMNGEYIRSASTERLIDLCIPYMAEAGLISGLSPTQEERSFLQSIMPLLVERMKVLSEVSSLADYFYKPPAEYDEKGKRKWLTGQSARKMVSAILAAITEHAGEWTVHATEELVNNLAETMGCSRGPIIHSIRISVTGRTVGPGLFDILVLIGRDETMRRLNTALNLIQD